jgi:hypothetical protein
VREYLYDVYFQLLESAKKALQLRENDGKGKFQSLFEKILEDGDKGFTEEQVAFVGGGLLDAAVDTT